MIKKIMLLCLISMNHAVFAQSTGIGTASPNASAKLEIASSTQGVLIPRMTTSQRNDIASPAVGLQIFNLDDQCTDIFDGSNWIKSSRLKVNNVLFFPGHPTKNSWVRKTDLIGRKRQGAVGFSIRESGYIFTGDSSTIFEGPYGDRKFWAYNANENTWAQKADFPGVVRSLAVAFSIGDIGYVGTGIEVCESFNNPSNCDNGNYLKDFWSYSATNNSWTQKANFGGHERFGAVGFSAGGKGYIGTGNYSTCNNSCYGGSCSDTLVSDFWEYNPNTDGWTRIADFPGGARWGATAFSIGIKGYIGTGKNRSSVFAGATCIQIDTVYKDFWEYNTANSSWTRKADLLGEKRSGASGFSIIDTGYLGGGSGNDFWKYKPESDSWTRIADLPGQAKSFAVGFSIGKRGFIGTGTIPGNESSRELWEYVDDNVLALDYTSQIVSPVNNIVTEGGWTIANSILYNSNSGNVGINNGSPISKLHIINSSSWDADQSQQHGLAISSVADLTGQHLLMGADGGNNKLSYIQSRKGSSNNFLSLNPRGGRVGIRTTSPSQTLSVAGAMNVGNNYGGTAVLAGGLSFGSASNSNGAHGEGIERGFTPARLQLLTDNVRGITIGNNGKVGIGVFGFTPPSAALEINPIGVQTVGAGWVYQPVGGAAWGGGSVNYAIAVKSTGSYIGTYYFAVSDQRIKNITGRSNPATDLSTINQLQVTDYTYIDKPAKGSQQMKGFIAQEVEKLIPDAVNTMTDFIPNIYTNAQKVTKQKNGNLLLTLNKPHAMKAGDMVRLYNDRQQDCKVEQVVNSNSFVVSGFNGSTDKVFVYGQQVNDYKSVDYDRLFSTGIGAIQELSKQVDAVKAGIQADDKEFEERVKQLEKQLQEKKEMQPVVTSWK